ncbi:MAG: hypothetical protein ACXVB0_00220 [Mucilaginibacter sp.]
MPTEFPNKQLLENQYFVKENKSLGTNNYINLIGDFAKMNYRQDRFIL